MPANFGEIAGYNSRLAARYLALAQAARDRGDLGVANYQAGQAARYVQAAQEQTLAMRQAPGRSVANQKPRRWPPEPQPLPLAATLLLAVLRGAGDAAKVIRQSISRRNPPFNGLSLH